MCFEPLVAHELRVDVFDLEGAMVNAGPAVFASCDEKAVVVDVLLAQV